MIIPIKCFTCGKVLANKYQYYQKEVLRQKSQSTDENADEFIYLKKGVNEKTIEGKVMDQLGLTRYCCRRHMLTHVDIE